MGNGSTRTQWLSERWQLKEIGLNIQVAVHIDNYYQCIYAMMTNIVPTSDLQSNSFNKTRQTWTWNNILVAVV